jgi:hypothetical protein
MSFVREPHDNFPFAPGSMVGGPVLDAMVRSEIDGEAALTKPIEFSDTCEAEFAGMLNAHDIPWQYKPRTFAVEWDDEGNFVDCFTPDFFLPANETFVVLIAPDRGAFDWKTRKVKLLRRQHPEIRIEVIPTAHHHRVETVS